MHASIKREWLKRLRSGKYQQAKGLLRTGEGYCCLGVLSDIYVDAHADVVWVPSDPDCADGGKELYGEESMTPPQVVKWAGMNDHNPTVTIDARAYECSEDMLVDGRTTFEESLSELNDSYDLDFNAIADLIEAQL